MPLNTILVPLDGSAESNAALPLARTLAQATGASVTLLRVLSHTGPEATQTIASNLEKVASELASSGIGVQSTVRQGRAADEILAEVRARPTSLVVMRTHGRVGIERAILGSVTEQVLARCEVPVVLMRPGERRITGIRKLLVPVDGSAGGELAVGVAAGLAQQAGAAMHLVQVSVPVALQGAPAFDGSSMAFYDPAWDDESMAAARESVAGVTGRLRERGLNVDGNAVEAPDVAAAIVEMAEQDGADLVVMSTRALTGPARTLLGSVADAVVRTAHCPVLLVHRLGAADDQPATDTSTVASTSTSTGG
ncbi:MAG: universal stress protein [Chloroflexi bacterium]|nr:universal stress protein [Chloroflexota bacterium]